MKFRCVLVENEEPSLMRLKRLLSAYPDYVEIVGEAVDGPSAVEMIRNLRPELVFLDIDLPGFNGFQVLEHLDVQPAVVFTTAFNDYALKAFKVFAVDYLLKPLDEEGVGRSLEKLQAMGFNHTRLALALNQLLARMNPSYPARISCKVGDRTVLVKMEDVLYFRADNKYVAVQTEAHEYLIDTPIIELVKKLDPKDFVQIHRATLVNVAWISETRRSAEGRQVVFLKNGAELVVSRHYADNLKSL